MHGATSTLDLLLAQVPGPVSQASLPFLGDLLQGGPWAVISILLLVVKHLYSEIKAAHADRDKLRENHQTGIEKMRDAHAVEVQKLNDRILDVNSRTTVAVLQNTEVQKQLIEAINNQEQP